jgi:hypothetical protein
MLNDAVNTDTLDDLVRGSFLKFVEWVVHPVTQKSRAEDTEGLVEAGDRYDQVPFSDSNHDIISASISAVVRAGKPFVTFIP